MYIYIQYKVVWISICIKMKKFQFTYVVKVQKHSLWRKFVLSWVSSVLYDFIFYRTNVVNKYRQVFSPSQHTTVSNIWCLIFLLAVYYIVHSLTLCLSNIVLPQKGNQPMRKTWKHRSLMPADNYLVEDCRNSSWHIKSSAADGK